MTLISWEAWTRTEREITGLEHPIPETQGEQAARPGRLIIGILAELV